MSIVNWDDFIGKKINALTVLSIFFRPRGKRNDTYFECLCDCGKVTRIRAANLKSGKRKSCGCINNRHRNPKLDLIGQTINYLTVIDNAPSPENDKKSTYFL